MPSARSNSRSRRSARPSRRWRMPISRPASTISASSEPLRDYQERHDEFARQRRHLGRLRRVPAVTCDEVEIRLDANLELPVELEQAVVNGAMGLGLVRTEFLYMNREDLPGEDEQ